MRSGEYDAIRIFTFQDKNYKLLKFLDEVYDAYKMQCAFSKIRIGELLPEGMKMEACIGDKGQILFCYKSETASFVGRNLFE